jgi:amino acid transporter
MSGFGSTLLGIICLIILLALAFWPARVARRKGHSWLLFFIFSLFFFFPALIVAYLVRDRRSLAGSRA